VVYCVVPVPFFIAVQPWHLFRPCCRTQPRHLLYVACSCDCCYKTYGNHKYKQDNRPHKNKKNIAIDLQKKAEESTTIIKPKRSRQRNQHLVLTTGSLRMAHKNVETCWGKQFYGELQYLRVFITVTNCK
jgi:hypothetical protein